jgi:hypothetical protein
MVLVEGLSSKFASRQFDHTVVFYKILRRATCSQLYGWNLYFISRVFAAAE